jgi:hypothetical protein
LSRSTVVEEVQPTHWRIVPGNPTPDEADERKSVLLGDWLRHDYISIGWKEGPQYDIFASRMQNGHKVVVTTDSHIWAIGIVIGNCKKVRPARESYRFPYERKVKWSKVMRVRFTDFPKALANKLGRYGTINKLDLEDWETLLLFI